MPFPLFSARRLLTAALLALTAIAAEAMSVIAPTFDQLVTAAPTVFRGTVTDVHSVTVDTPQGQAIRTLVTFHVDRSLKGDATGDVTLSFLGGKVGHRTLKVLGMPTFSVGDREIVFVSSTGNAICPVLAGGHGRYHIRHDINAGRDFVARENNAPLTSTDEIAKPLEETAPNANSAAALSPDDFEGRIIATARNSRLQQP